MHALLARQSPARRDEHMRKPDFHILPRHVIRRDTWARLEPARTAESSWHEITDAPHCQAFLAKDELLHDEPSTLLLGNQSQKQQAPSQDHLRLPARGSSGTCESQQPQGFVSQRSPLLLDTLQCVICLGGRGDWSTCQDPCGNHHSQDFIAAPLAERLSGPKTGLISPLRSSGTEATVRWFDVDPTPKASTGAWDGRGPPCDVRRLDDLQSMPACWRTLPRCPAIPLRAPSDVHCQLVTLSLVEADSLFPFSHEGHEALVPSRCILWSPVTSILFSEFLIVFERSMPESRRPSLRLDLVQLTVSQVVLRQRRGTFLARASPNENTGHADKREIDGRGKPTAVSESTNKEGSCRKSERKDRRRTPSTVFKKTNDAENPEDRGIPPNKACKKQRWNAQHTLRRSSQTNQHLFRRISPRSRIGPIKEVNTFNKEGSADIGVKVPSTSNPKILISEEVQNCR